MEPWQKRNEDHIAFCRKFEEGEEGNAFLIYSYLNGKKSGEFSLFPTRERAEETRSTLFADPGETFEIVEMGWQEYAESHDRPIPEKILPQIVSNRIENKSYHSELPKDLATWYCYLPDAGHSVLCAIKRIYNPYGDPKEFMVPVPVKTVQRVGYEKYYSRYLIVDVPYDDRIGLIVPQGDEEF